MKQLIVAGIVVLFATAVTAQELVILNSGSATGGFSMQSTAYSTDLADAYDIELINPGDRCIALGSILPNLNGPVLMPWASDYEAVGRDGGCETFDITSARVLRYDSAPLYVCTRGGDITINSGRVAHTVPVDGPLYRVVLEFNTQFGTTHTPIVYDGSGDARLALLNGEVDYALLSRKHVNVVIETDPRITCDQSLASVGVNSLPEATGNQNLAFGWDMVWLALNMTDEQANELQRQMLLAHIDCDSAIGVWTECGAVYDTEWNLSLDEINRRWEPMVVSQRGTE